MKSVNVYFGPTTLIVRINDGSFVFCFIVKFSCISFTEYIIKKMKAPVIYFQKYKKKILTASALLRKSNSTVTFTFSFLQMTFTWVSVTVCSADWMVVT